MADPVSTGIGVAGLALGAVSTALGIFGSSSANKRAKREAAERNRRAREAAALTRTVGITQTRAQAAQQREKVSRDTNLLLGQLVVSAAERNVLESGSTEQGIQTIIQGMNYNLSQINTNRYLTEQSIIAQTQYPDVMTYQPINVMMAGLQGGLQGLSMGLELGQTAANLGWFRGGGSGGGGGPAYFGYTPSGTPQAAFSSTPSNPEPPGLQFGGPRLA